mgnify:CR=1 FL=1
MEKQKFNTGIGLTALGSFWWGVIGVIYFKYISFAGSIEVVIHRCVWTSVVLIITTFYFSKWNIFFEIINPKTVDTMATKKAIPNDQSKLFKNTSFSDFLINFFGPWL